MPNFAAGLPNSAEEMPNSWAELGNSGEEMGNSAEGLGNLAEEMGNSWSELGTIAYAPAARQGIVSRLQCLGGSAVRIIFWLYARMTAPEGSQLETEQKNQKDLISEYGPVYQIAGRMIAAENHLWWTRFGVFIASNSVVLAVIGVLFRESNESRFEIGILAIFGMLLALIFLVAGLRGEFWHEEYSKVGKALEERMMLDQEISIFKQASSVDRVVTNKRLGLLVNLLFVLLFIGIAIHSLTPKANEGRTNPISSTDAKSQLGQPKEVKL